MEKIKAIHVTVNDDGTTSNGSIFSAIGDERFYLDHIEYIVDEDHLVVTDYDEEKFSGTANIVSSITYKGNTYEVLEVGWCAFKNCSSLTSVTLPESVTKIEKEAFYGCSSLTSINIPEDVKKIGKYAFQKCTSLTSVNIPKSVKKIEQCVFDGCSSLTSVTLLKSVKNIEWGAFKGCSSLTSIDLPGVTSIGDHAFEGCSSLTSITIPKSTKKIETWVFAGCSSLTSITVSEGNPVYDSREGCNAIIETASNKLLYGCMNTIIPESVTSIGYYAFWGCSSLTSIVIPESVTSIEGGTFSGCSSLTSMTVSEGNPVYDSREGCNAIIKTASNLLIAGCQNTIIPESVKFIGNWAFKGCSALTSIVIPNSVTEIGSQAFMDCKSLTSIVIPESVTKIEYQVFFGCSSLTSITVSEGNPVYDSREGCNAIIETASNKLLYGCMNTIIPESVTSIGGYAFDSSAFTSIVIPESVTSIEDSVFRGCSALTSMTVSEGNPVYDSREGCNAIIKTASNTLIHGCMNTIIPESVTSIGRCAFWGRSSLTTVTCRAENVPDLYDPPSVFSGVPKSEATLYVPASALEAYKAADQWKDFGTILPIEG